MIPKVRRVTAARPTCKRCRQPVRGLKLPARCGICSTDGLCLQCWGRCCETSQVLQPRRRATA